MAAICGVGPPFVAELPHAVRLTQVGVRPLFFRLRSSAMHSLRSHELPDDEDETIKRICFIQLGKHRKRLNPIHHRKLTEVKAMLPHFKMDELYDCTSDLGATLLLIFGPTILQMVDVSALKNVRMRAAVSTRR